MVKRTPKATETEIQGTESSFTEGGSDPVNVGSAGADALVEEELNAPITPAEEPPNFPPIPALDEPEPIAPDFPPAPSALPPPVEPPPLSPPPVTATTDAAQGVKEGTYEFAKAHGASDAEATEYAKHFDVDDSDDLETPEVLDEDALKARDLEYATQSGATEEEAEKYVADEAAYRNRNKPKRYYSKCLLRLHETIIQPGEVVEHLGEEELKDLLAREAVELR